MSSVRAEVAAWRVLYAPEPLATKLGLVLDELEAAEKDREQLARELQTAEESEQRYWSQLVAARELLREAHERLMVSEGDARYIDNNVALAERIDAALGAR